MSDLLWSDPSPRAGRLPSQRGVGCMFGPDITEAFLRQNNLELVIRSHEVWKPWAYFIFFPLPLSTYIHLFFSSYFGGGGGGLLLF